MTNRQIWIDCVRGIGAFLVVLGHLYQNEAIGRFIYGFHMPLFFILSGYLIKDGDSVITYKKTITLVRRYIVPYFIYCFINFAVQMYLIKIGYKWAVAFKSDYRKYLWGIITLKGGVEWMPNCSPLWYMTAIFGAMLLWLAINAISDRTVRNCILALCPIISYFLYIKGIDIFLWNLDVALMGVLF